MGKYLNSPGTEDWFACPTCGDEVRVGSAGCARCRSYEELNRKHTAAARGKSIDDEDDGELEEIFDYDEWHRREFGKEEKFKPYGLRWYWWLTGVGLVIALVWAWVLAGFAAVR